MKVQRKWKLGMALLMILSLILVACAGGNNDTVIQRSTSAPAAESTTPAPATESTTPAPAEQDKPATDGQVIKVGMMEWSLFTGADLPRQGLMTAIAQAAMEAEGYTFETHIMPWARAFEMTQNGEMDALIGASKTEEREQWFSYPNPLWALDTVFYTQAGNDTTYTSMEDLAPALVGSLTGSFLVGVLEEVDGFTVETTATLEQNILKLADGRLDYLIEYSTPVEYLLATSMSEHASAIVPMDQPAFENLAYIVFSKENERYMEYTEAFNRGLETIKTNGVYDEILVLYGLN